MTLRPLANWLADWLFGRRRAETPEAVVWVPGETVPEDWAQAAGTAAAADQFRYDTAQVEDEDSTTFDPAYLTRTVTMTQPLSPEAADRLAVWFESLHDCHPPLAVDGVFQMTGGSGDLRQTIRRGGTQTTWTCPRCRVDWLLTGTEQHWYRPNPLTFRKATT